MPKRATGSIFLGKKKILKKLEFWESKNIYFFGFHTTTFADNDVWSAPSEKTGKIHSEPKKSDMFVFELFEINPVLLIDFFAKLAIFHHFLQIFFVFYLTAFSDAYPDIILVPGWEFEQTF